MTGASRSADPNRLILIAGATGYVGGRLLAALQARGERVRCLVRRPQALLWRAAPRTEVVRGDCLDPASLPPALAGVDTAYYLVHSLGAGPGFAALDRQAAAHFGAAARVAGVRRVVYLGGLGAEEEGLSKHLRSRLETGDLLRAEGVDVVEFRASIEWHGVRSAKLQFIRDWLAGRRAGGVAEMVTPPAAAGPGTACGAPSCRACRRWSSAARPER